MNEERFFNVVSEQSSASAAFPALIRKVYLWMTLALVITGITAYGVASSQNLVIALFSNRALFWGLAIAEFAIVVLLSARLHKLSLTTATLMFIVYSVLNGVLLSSLLLVFTEASIAKTFFICAGTFGAMSLIGYSTKTDLSSMGKILFMALIGLIIATVVNFFMHSQGLEVVISYAGVLIFVGLTAWDTQKIKNMLAQAEYMDEGAQKLALIGALSLYLDFINLFIYLLRILGDRK